MFCKTCLLGLKTPQQMTKLISRWNCQFAADFFLYAECSSVKISQLALHKAAVIRPQEEDQWQGRPAVFRHIPFFSVPLPTV